MISFGLVLSLAALASADEFQDQFPIELDEAQISGVMGDMTWQLEGLTPVDQLLLDGDIYTADFAFTGEQGILVTTGLDMWNFQARGASALTYEVGYELFGLSEGGDLESLAFGDLTSDASGIVGGEFEIDPERDLELAGLRLELAMTSGSTTFTGLDIGLSAASFEIVPEPVSLLGLFAATLLLRRR
jgi:hypothetical protein